jgi:hypothetical protein
LAPSSLDGSLKTTSRDGERQQRNDGESLDHVLSSPSLRYAGAAREAKQSISADMISGLLEANKSSHQ